MGDITSLILLVSPMRGIFAVERLTQKWKIQVSSVLGSRLFMHNQPQLTIA